MAFDVEQIFGAMDIILAQRLQDVSFDKTLICTIVDDSDKKNGHYIVTDGTIKFDAYVSDATYKNDDQVRVSVLGGDFSDKKFIAGKYVADENTGPITYVSPLEGIIPITGNLFSNGSNVFSIKANGTPRDKVLWNINLTDNAEFRDLQSNGIYNTITLKADFKTLLSHYNLKSGNFGLRLDLFIQPSLNSPRRIRKWVSLDSSEFFGNPYAFSIYSTQGKKINIASTGVIAEMALWLYQGMDGDGNDSYFLNKKGEQLNPNKTVNGQLVQMDDDILVKNIEIGFGSDITSITDNTLELYTYSSPTYLYDNHTQDTNEKELELLWYNKTENNEYVGFSDGIYDLDYDEIDYLKLAHQDSRLVAQVGREGIPTDKPGLTLAADMQEAKPIMISTREYLTKDLNSVIRSFSNQVLGVNSFVTLLDSLLNTTNGAIITAYNNAMVATDSMIASYEGVLRFAYDKQKNVQDKTSWDVAWETNYYTNFKTAFNTVLDKIDVVLKDIEKETRADASFSGYRGIYDTYDTRIRREMKVVTDRLKQIDTLMSDNHSMLIAYKNDAYQFNEYTRKDFSDYANKYCIYWYRYERGYKLTYDSTEGANNDEYNFGQFVTDNWRRLTPTEDSILKNLGLPRNEADTKLVDGKKYYPPKAIGEKLVRYMNNKTQEEKYMVVLFYNHEMYKSNIITFTNSEDVPDEYLVDQRDALRIEHDVQSFEHYQSYDVTNMLINVADGGKVRQLKCFYEGLFSGDEALIDAGLYWYIPNTATMLTFDKDDLIKEGFATDADLPEGEKSDKSRPGFTYFYKKVGKSDTPLTGYNPDGTTYTYDTCKNEDRYFFYKIKPYFEQAASKNTIEVWAYLPNVTEPIKGEISFTFSTFGTNGTRYTLAITPATSQIAVIGAPSYTRITTVTADNYEPNVYYIPDGDDYKLATEEYSSALQYYTVAANHSLPLEVSLRDASNNKIPMVDGSMSENADEAYAFKTSWMGPTTYIAHSSDSNGDGSIDSITITRDTRHDENQYYYGILKASVQFKYDDEAEQAKQETQNNPANVDKYQKYRVLDLNALYAVPYSSSGQYYISGPTSIVYNNQGVVSHMSEDPFCLYQVNDKENKPVENQRWVLEYYSETGEWIDETHDDWLTMLNYMPVLNAENGLTAAPMYMQGLPYYPVAICTVDGNILWVQPIIITQNRYASSTLNDWNGSLTIDEKNGTILSTMVGAGKKETDNSFSGLLMGDIGAGANFDTDNYNGLGLYGFHYGAQSLALTIDGKAFFGKAGRGRIYIDGDSGSIASASYEEVRRKGEQLTSAGMFIDLDDGFIHMLGSTIIDKTYSPDYPDGKTSQAEVLLSTGMKHGEKDAYFKIRSKDQPNKDHYLIYVDTDNYYLQTDNYVATEYSPSDSTGRIPSGEGFHLNLKDGRLDAYNFQLVSKNVYIDSRDESTAFFVIKDNYGINLFYAGTDGSPSAQEVFYLKSSDYNETNHTGTKIDLTNGSITSYDFTLIAGNTTGNNPTIELTSSGTPYLRIRNDSDKTLLSIQKKTVDDVTGAIITNEEFYLQSGNFVSGSSGTKIDLVNNTLNAYSGFTLKAYKGTQYVLLDATADAYPLKVYGSDEKYFQVNWDGGLTATGADIKGTINATSGSFNGKITAIEGEIGGWTINADSLSGTNITLNSGGSMSCGDGFSVDSDGGLTATSGTIGGWEVGPSTLSCGGLTLGGGGGISSSLFNVDETTGATTIEDLIVINTLTVNGTGTLTCDGGATFGGDVSLTGGLTIDTASLTVGDATAYAAAAETIRVDVPFEKGYDITIHNGIITNVVDVGQSALSQWWDSIWGNNAKPDTATYATTDITDALAARIAALEAAPPAHSHKVSVSDYTSNTYSLSKQADGSYKLTSGGGASTTRYGSTY